MKSALKFRGLLTGGASILAIALATAPALAQSAPPTEADDVIVIVGQTIEETLPQELAKYGNQVEVVSSEEIRNQLYVDAQQALRMEVPGLYVNPQMGPFSYMDISLQGSRTQDLMLTVDGVRINNRLYSGTMSDTLPASMIERIEVLKGGQGLFYGTQSAAGVINMVTRGYTDEFNGSATVGGDTNNGLHLDAYVRGAAGPGNFVVYGSRDVGEGFDAYTQYAPSATDRKRSYDVNAYGAKYRVELGDNLAIDARYHHADAKNDNLSPRRVAFSKNVRDEDVASLGVDFKAAEWAQILVKAYWHDWDSHVTALHNVLQGGTGPIIAVSDQGTNVFWGFEDKGVNALAKFTPGGPFEYLVGYDYQTYSGKDDFLLIAEKEEDVHAFFGQVRSTPDLIKNASFAAGFRHSEGTGSKITVWNASGRYDFSPALYAEANIGTSFLLPTAEELYAIESFEIGNPNVEAEESMNFNAGLGGQFGANAMFSWQATYFARDIDNLIGFEDCSLPTTSTGAANPDYDSTRDCAVLFPTFPVGPDPFPGTPYNDAFDGNGFYINVDGTVEVRGFELTGVAHFQNGFSASASYTDSTTKDEDGSQRPRVPRRTFKAGGNYDAGQWGVNVSGLFVGEIIPSTPGLANYGDYFVVDVAGHYYLDVNQTHKLTVRLQNALDEEYSTNVGRSTPSAGFDTTPAFVFGVRGAPQTLHVSYSYAF